jgi:hypothetical protein
LKNYKKDIEESEKLRKVNQRDLDRIQLKLDKDNIYRSKEEWRMTRVIGSSLIGNNIAVGKPTASIGEQSDTCSDYTIDNLIRSTLSKLYIMLIIYMLEWMPFFLTQTLFKLINMPISSTLDGVGYFLVHLFPIANPCFVLFFHSETYQELRFFIYLSYYKFFN